MTKMRYTYRKKQSLTHRLHPVTQVTLVSVLILFSLLCDNPLVLASIIAATAVLAFSADVFAEWLSWWRLCLVIGLLALVLNPLLSHRGATVLWLGPRLPVIGRIDITLEAVAFGAAMALRIVAVVWAFALLSLTLDPDRLLGLLKGTGSRSALLTTLSLRLVPTVARDAGDILDAQRSRGIALDRGGRYRVLKSRLPLVRRLATTSLDRGIGLAEAMEARAYGSGRRSRYREYGVGAADVVLLATAGGIAALLIATLATGTVGFGYYPVISWRATPLTVTAACLPLVLALIVLGLSESWKRSNWLKSRA